MSNKEILKKAESNEGLSVEEIKVYQDSVKPVEHVYGKYGNLAKTYLEEHNVGKLWSLSGSLPEYLHGIDKAAEELYETMYAKLSKDERFKKTDDFLDNLRKETEMQNLIEEEILKEIVYVD